MTTRQQTNFTQAINHYCKNLTVSVGCMRSLCEHAENDDDEDHQCEPSFSWQSCDSCGSNLGGDRFKAYGILTDDLQADLFELDICVDCAMFHANGELPDEWD